jgi:DNA-binding LacI/PurR family transcriptional regulator
VDSVGKRGRPSRRVRLEDIARRCEVSVATVSRALSGAPGVRPDLVAAVREAAADVGYAVPPSLSGLGIVVVASAAAMLDHARSQFTLNVMQGIEDRAAAMRATVTARAVSDPAEVSAILRAAEADPKVAGVLFLTLDEPAMLEAARGAGRPVVLVNGDDPLMHLSSLAPSNRAAAALATEHLLRLGHRRILFLMRRGRRTIERRFEGWRDRIAPPGSTLDPDLVVEVEDWLPDLAERAIAARLAARGPDFTAILAAGDSLAFGALAALAARGIAVPGQVSVMGMDGLPQGAFQNPPLSAMEMPMRAIGAAAIDLIRDLRSGVPLPARRIELACRLIERGSTGPAPADPLPG